MTESAPLYNSRLNKVYIQYLSKHYADIDIDAVLNEAGILLGMAAIFFAVGVSRFRFE